MGNWVSKNSWVSNSMGNWVSNNSCLDNSRSILRNSLIGDILDPPVRKSNSIAAGGCVSISRLSLLEVSSTVVITDPILVIVHWGLSKVWGGIARGSNQRACGGSGTHTEQGSANYSLHVVLLF